MANLLFSFFEKVQLPDDPSDCWEWQGSMTPQGYATVRVGTRQSYAYRVLYEASRGPVDEGLQMDHLCRNTSCVNPWHLEPVPPAENKVRAERAVSRWDSRTHCKNGHEQTDENTFELTSRPRKFDGSIPRYCKVCRNESQRRNYLKKKAREQQEASS